jgi:Uma2 family endonuclease
MAALIESEAGPVAPFDLAVISQQLAADVSRLVPYTNGFTVEDYLSLDGPYLVEFDDGRLQILPMPDGLHQAIISVLNDLLRDWLKVNDPEGRRKFSPFKVRLSDRDFREPDISCMLGKHAARRHRGYWDGADVVFEVISESNRRHDVTTKYFKYEAAGFPEYWIIDPENRTVEIYLLTDGKYRPLESSVTAASVTLPGFGIGVAELFAKAEAEE